MHEVWDDVLMVPIHSPPSSDQALIEVSTRLVTPCRANGRGSGLPVVRVLKKVYHSLPCTTTSMGIGRGMCGRVHFILVGKTRRE